MCDPEHIEDIIHQHNLALDRLLESDKDAADIIPVVEDDFSRIRQGLSKEYAYFHGLLQARLVNNAHLWYFLHLTLILPRLFQQHYRFNVTGQS